MAVFFINSCKFNGCGKTFPSLSSLIEHIEAAHIDFDPKVAAEFEQQRPSSVPLSYVLKYSHSRPRKTTSIDIRIRLLQHANKVALERNNNFERENEEEEIISESDSSNDSWTPSKGVYIPGRRIGKSNLVFKDKPFACSVPGCKKRYKNVNGIKYHCKNGHKLFQRSKKPHKHVSKKNSKQTDLQLFPNRIFEDEVVTTVPRTVASVDLLPTSENYGISQKCSITGNISQEVIKSEPFEDESKEQEAPVQDQLNNNIKICTLDCTSTCISVYNPWSTGNVDSKNDLTIIRSGMQGIEDSKPQFDN